MPQSLDISLGSLLRLLSEVEADDLRRMIEAVDNLQSSESWRERIEALLMLIDVITQFIPGEVDDAVVDSITQTPAAIVPP